MIMIRGCALPFGVLDTDKDTCDLFGRWATSNYIVQLSTSYYYYFFSTNSIFYSIILATILDACFSSLTLQPEITGCADH